MAPTCIGIYVGVAVNQNCGTSLASWHLHTL